VVNSISWTELFSQLLKYKFELKNCWPNCRMYIFTMPVPLAARSKAEVCGRSPAEIVGSNPT